MGVSFDEYDLTASVCRESFYQFFINFWPQIIQEELILNWHIKYLCDDMQKAAELVFANKPKEQDRIYNVPPGTTKSSVASIMFPAWVLTRMAHARSICVSHTDTLVMDLSRKSRDVVRSDLYQRCFGVPRKFRGLEQRKVVISDDQDTKGYWATTDGGMRFCATVGGRSPTGMHGHFLVCLPWESVIATDHGPLPIGMIVDQRLPIRVLGYDVEKRCNVWQEVEGYERNPGRPTNLLSFSNGVELELTDEHPVFVVGKGYIPAASLEVGDQVVYEKIQNRNNCVPALPEGCRGVSRPGQEVLLSQVLCRRKETDEQSMEDGSVSSLWNESCTQDEEARQTEGWGVLYYRLLWAMAGGESGGQEPPPIQAQNNQVRTVWQEAGIKAPRPHKILQSALQGVMDVQQHSRQASFPIQQCNQTLQGVWQENAGAEGATEDPTVLQQQMSVYWDEWGEQSCAETQIQNRMWILWNAFEAESTQERMRSLLFKRLCKQRAFGTNEGGGQFQLYTRRRPSPVSNGIQCRVAQEDTQKGGISLFQVWGSAKETSPPVGCSSYRLEQIQQQELESCCSVSGVPPATTWRSKETEAGCKVVLTAIKRAVRIPGSVYNIRTSLNHNYFANGVLVHNCDDPIDPKKVLSDSEIQAANQYMREVLPGRKTDKRVSVMFYVMQRLHQDDPTGNRIANKKAGPVKHVILPCDTSFEVKPAHLKAKYKDGLLDPLRLPYDVLETERGTMGEFAYSSQMGQCPIPLGGGMFKVAKINIETPPQQFVRVVRYWDTAGSLNGAYTAGVKMAKDAKGRFWVLHVKRGRWAPEEREATIKQTAQVDGRNVYIYVEQQGGSSGKEVAEATCKMLAGYRAAPDRPTGDKTHRAEPFAGQMNIGNVYVPPDQEWFPDYADELQYAPASRFRDQMDASSGAFKMVTVKIRVGGVNI